MNDAETDEPGWTKENLQNLFSGMKLTITTREKDVGYNVGVKTLNWANVAFPPFSAEDCQRKWDKITFEMRKIRTLTELLNEAEEVIGNPSQNPNKRLYSRKLFDHKSSKHKLKTTPGSSDSVEADGVPPIPPRNGYVLFCKEQLQQQGNISGYNSAKRGRKRWKDLSPCEKNVYNERCKEVKKEHKSQMESYLSGLNFKETNLILAKNNIRLPRNFFKMETEPKKPPRCGSLLYVQHQMEHLKNDIPNSKERFLKANQMWRELPDQEKQSYNKKAKDRMSSYSSELLAWFMRLPEKQKEAFKHQYPAKMKFIEIDILENSDPLPSASDSEDEDLVDSSSDEEEDRFLKLKEEDKSEEEEADSMFEMY